MSKRICSVEGCDRVHFCRGWCKKHWQRWYRNGDPVAQRPAPPPPAPCSVEGCSGVAHLPAWEMCQKHYTRFKRHGHTGDPRRRRISERFWSKVDKCGAVPAYRPNLGPCWIWTRYCDPLGYGRFRVPGATMLAHVWAFQAVAGPIQPGLELDHLCRVPSCVRPDHLEPVTHRVNVQRGAEARRTC